MPAPASRRTSRANRLPPRLVSRRASSATPAAGSSATACRTRYSRVVSVAMPRIVRSVSASGKISQDQTRRQTDSQGTAATLTAASASPRQRAASTG